MSSASIAAEVKGVGSQPVSAQTICLTLYQIGKPAEFAEDKQTKYMDYWNHVLWSDETKINVFGSDGVKRVRSTKTSMSCLQTSMVVGVSWSGAA